jgi:hypothetical protein
LLVGEELMIIKLFQPASKNWLLIAEQLDDPETWDRFVPCHTTKSQRWQFESTVKEHAAGLGLKLKVCKDLLKHGTSVFEYDWNTLDDDILGHAMQVADILQIELQMGAPTSPSESSYTAA